MLSPRFFEDFVNAVAQSFSKYKRANNGFIGILAKNIILMKNIILHKAEQQH